MGWFGGFSHYFWVYTHLVIYLSIHGFFFENSLSLKSPVVRKHQKIQCFFLRERSKNTLWSPIFVVSPHPHGPPWPYLSYLYGNVRLKKGENREKLSKTDLELSWSWVDARVFAGQNASPAHQVERNFWWHRPDSFGKSFQNSFSIVILWRFKDPSLY